MSSLNRVATFPLIIPTNTNGTHYQGFITVQNKEFSLEIHLQEAHNLKEARLFGDPELKRLLHDQEEAILNRLEQCTDIHTFFLDLKHLIEDLLTQEPQEKLLSTEYYTTILSEIDSIGWDKVEKIDADFQKVALVILDSAGRRHSLVLQFSENFPTEPPECLVELPESINFKINRDDFHLVSIIEQYCEVLEKYNEVWNMLDDLDQNTWVLEPEKPTRNIMMRRIALGNLCSLQIDLNPQEPHSIPQCQIFGAESAIAPIRKLINENLRSWDFKETPRENLERILAIKFPSRHASTKNELSVECGICYSYRLDENIPDQLCSNNKCGQPFHNRCLYEWLRAVPSTRQSFSTLFGLCPYCNDTITTKVIDI